MQYQLTLHLILMILGCIGLCLSAYIYHCKAQKKPLICPMKGHCDEVTSSAYSKFCGCRVEVLGITFYSAVILLNGAVAFYPEVESVSIIQASLIITALASIFSLYLVSVQAFVIKKWCTWCICSALLTASILIVTYLGAPAGIL